MIKMAIMYIFMGVAPVMLGVALLDHHVMTAATWLAVWVVAFIGTRDR